MMTQHVTTTTSSIQRRTQQPTRPAMSASKFHVISKINTICILDCLARSAGAVLASIKANKAAAVAELEWESDRETSKHSGCLGSLYLPSSGFARRRWRDSRGAASQRFTSCANSNRRFNYWYRIYSVGNFLRQRRSFGWDGSERQDFGFSHNALERKRAHTHTHRRRSAVEILI